MSNRLNINNTSEPTLNGLLDFDGSTYVYLESEPDITGDKTIFFNLYLDSDVISVNNAAIVSFSHVADRTDQFMVYVYSDANPDRIQIVPSNDSADAKYIETTGLEGKRLSWEISKSAGVINYVKINGEEKSLSSFAGGFIQPDIPGIGRRKLEGTNINAFGDGLIWDVEIKDGSTGTGTSLYKWEGYPGGDQNSGWLDQSGTVDGSVTGIDNNVPSTRDLLGSGTTSRLELSLPSASYDGVLVFDGSTRILLYSGENDDIRFDKNVRWKMYLDQETGWSSQWLLAFWGINAQTDLLRCVLDGSLFYITAGPWTSTFARSFPLAELSNKELSIEVDKREFYLNYVKVNGVTQTLTATSNSYSNPIAGWQLGNKDNTIGPNTLSKASIWDLEVYDTSTAGSPLIHYWKGYPNGNTDGAWTDDVSTWDGDVITTAGGAQQTRDIQSSSGSSNVLTASRKLFIGETVIPPLFSFVTDSESTSFDPQLFVSSGIIEWDLGDGSILNSNSFSYTYTQPGNKTVKLYAGTTTGIDSIERFLVGNDDIQGDLDFSDFPILTHISLDDNTDVTGITIPTSGSFIFLGADDCNITGELDLSNFGQNPISPNTGAIRVRNNSNLTSIVIPSTDASIGSFWVNGNNLTGTLDASGLTNWSGGIFQCYQNSNLTSILMPNSVTKNLTFYAYQCNLTGELDLSEITGLNSAMRVDNNPNLTSLKLPVSSNTINQFYCNNTGITGTLDVSGLILGGSFLAHSNSNLTQILNPTSSQTFTAYQAYDCSLNGTLDLSELTGLGGSFNCRGNSNLTQILNPTSSQTFTGYQSYSCDLTGTLDVSGLTGLGGQFLIHFNSNLDSLILPASFSNSFSNFNVENCSLDQTSIDAIFSKLNSYYSSNTPTGSLIINADGGTNSPPTDGASNTDIQSLETIFSNASQDLTITINI